MTTYLPRTAWTTTPAAGSPMPSNPRGLAAHWPATNVPIGDPGQRAIAERLEGYRRFHVFTKGWADIAYQVAGDQAGRIWDLRGIDRMSAANGDRDVNEQYGAFLFLLGPGEQPTPALLQAFRNWHRDRWLARYPHATAVLGHQDVRPDPTSCPGPIVEALIKSGALTATPEEDMPLSEQDLDKIAFRVWSLPLPANDPAAQAAHSWLRQAALPVVVNGASAQEIAAALPDDLARQLADELARRLQGA